MTNRIPSDIEIAQAARLRPIRDLALELGLTDDELNCFGTTNAKVRLDALDSRKRRGRPCR
jgi:formate--tetrahydrofolate ligase